MSKLKIPFHALFTHFVRQQSYRRKHRLRIDSTARKGDLAARKIRAARARGFAGSFVQKWGYEETMPAKQAQNKLACRLRYKPKTM
jgi:hypothetical protein